MKKTESQFRRDFPAFADHSIYPESIVNNYLTLAYKFLLDSDAYVVGLGDNLDWAAELWTAHHLALYRRQMIAAGVAGGIPGISSGPATSKTVGSVSVSYDLGAIMSANAGQWNLTDFGRELWGILQSIPVTMQF